MALSGSARPGKRKPRSTVTVKTCYLLISSEFLPQGPRPNTCTYSCSESIFLFHEWLCSDTAQWPTFSVDIFCTLGRERCSGPIKNNESIEERTETDTIQIGSLLNYLSSSPTKHFVIGLPLKKGNFKFSMIYVLVWKLFLHGIP